MADLLKRATLVVLVGALGGLLSNAVRGSGRLDIASAPPSRDVCAGVLWTTPDALVRTLDERHAPLLLDARESGHYEDAHILGALSVPFRDGARVPGWVLERVSRARGKVVTYCDASLDCSRSTRLAEALLESGAMRGEVEVLQGGWPAWEHANLPAEVGPCEECPQ